MATYNDIFALMTQHLGIDRYTTAGLAHRVRDYMRHDTAQLMCDASKHDMLRLKYVRRYMVPNEFHKDDIFAHLAPSVCRSTVYGDENAPMCIIRTHISMGDRIKLRVIADTKRMNA